MCDVSVNKFCVLWPLVSCTGVCNVIVKTGGLMIDSVLPYMGMRKHQSCDGGMYFVRNMKVPNPPLDVCSTEFMYSLHVL